MAVPPLRALVDAGFEVALVVSRADRRRGPRRSASRRSPVKAAALELGLPVTDAVDDALAVGADLGVVVAFGRIIKPHVLAELPMVNLHFSLLPRWRGAAPVERALLAGDERTGVCVMDVEEGLDTGGTYACVEVPIGRGDRPRTSCGPSWSRSAPGCWSTRFGPGWARPRRRSASRPTPRRSTRPSSRSTGAGRRRRSTGSCGSAARGPPTTVAG